MDIPMFYLLTFTFIGSLNHCIALKFDRHIGSSADEVSVKFRSHRIILNTNLAPSRLHEILQYGVLSDTETGPRSPCGSIITLILEKGLQQCFSHTWPFAFKTLWIKRKVSAYHSNVSFVKWEVKRLRVEPNISKFYDKFQLIISKLNIIRYIIGHPTEAIHQRRVEQKYLSRLFLSDAVQNAAILWNHPTGKFVLHTDSLLCTNGYSVRQNVTTQLPIHGINSFVHLWFFGGKSSA